MGAMVLRNKFLFMIHLQNIRLQNYKDLTSFDAEMYCEAHAGMWTYNYNRFTALLHFGET